MTYTAESQAENIWKIYQHLAKSWVKVNWQLFSHAHAPPPTHTQTDTTVLWPSWISSGITRVSRHQKGKNQEGKTNLDLLEQEIVSGSSISWAICKSAL